jgi:glycosyltransferase involved in cell wall biosynthesis
MRTLFCNAAYGSGGIGQHFAQLVEETRRAGRLARYYTVAPRPDDPPCAVVDNPTYGLLRYTPIRFSPSWKNHVTNELFDRRTARRVSAGHALSGALMGFVGTSLHTFRSGAALGAEVLELVAANSHVDNVARLHARAAADSGVRDSWLNRAQRRKTRREYAAADRIYVHSDYVRDSFLAAGVPASKLVRTVLRVAPRFRPPDRRPSDSTFRIAYVGRVEMTKGIALLLEAFERLPVSDATLTIVGGWATAAVRRHVEARCAADPRIVVAPGDPLPVLHQADAFVSPSYEDGFGYAPMEALACGVPVVVSTDTGMKEYVRDGENGFVVPTGSAEAVLDALQTLHHTPRAATAPLLPAEVLGAAQPHAAPEAHAASSSPPSARFAPS